MHLKTSTNKKTGRTYLSMVRSYYDPVSKSSRTKTIESFGYLDELQKEFEDPLAHFQQVVALRNRKEEMLDAEYVIRERRDTLLPPNSSTRKNFGYVVILKLFYELGLDQFLTNWQRGKKIGYPTASIMKLLVLSRILYPGSKKKAFELRNRFFDFEKKSAFSLMNVYRALSHFASIQKEIQLHIHHRISKLYGRNLDLIYYDVTNYYFESDQEDGLTAKGVSKEHRPDPIVQMGLAMDAEGIPLSYEIFAGNESEKLHLRPMIRELRMDYDSGRVIAVADAAQNTGNNIYYLESGKNHYVFSQTIRGGSDEFKQYVIEDKGYKWLSKEYKRKSRNIRRSIWVDMVQPDGTTKKKDVLVDQRQIVFYSENYAERARRKREAAIKKAHRMVSNPSAYTKATSHGALRYVKNMEFDRKTGKYKEAKAKPCLDLERVQEEAKYDGYYCLVTNLFPEGSKKEFTDDRIIEIYRGLWQIEDSFRITKSDLETRPVYLSRHERIHAHFLTCFISLVILRLIQKRTGHKFSIPSLIEALQNISCTNETENLFLFDYRSDVTDAIGEAFDLNFKQKRRSRSEIKKILGNAKKVDFPL